jgi:hypothetical protein
VPPEQVVGSSIATKYEILHDGKRELLRLAKAFFIDDGPGKAVGINLFIGKRPIAAFCNSDADRRSLNGPALAPARGWCTTTTGRANTPTAPPAACSTPRSARFPTRCWPKPRLAAGMSSA